MTDGHRTVVRFNDDGFNIVQMAPGHTQFVADLFVLYVLWELLLPVGLLLICGAAFGMLRWVRLRGIHDRR